LYQNCLFCLGSYVFYSKLTAHFCVQCVRFKFSVVLFCLGYNMYVSELGVYLICRGYIITSSFYNLVFISSDLNTVFVWILYVHLFFLWYYQYNVFSIRSVYYVYISSALSTILFVSNNNVHLLCLLEFLFVRLKTLHLVCIKCYGHISSVFGYLYINIKAYKTVQPETFRMTTWTNLDINTCICIVAGYFDIDVKIRTSALPFIYIYI